MFTGLIETTGTLLAVEDRIGAKRIAIAAPTLASRLKTGDSIAVSGVCLTALDIGPETFHADLAAETVARTSLTHLAAGSVVNLELPTPAGTPLGGHIVQGHVDGTGTLVALNP
ncbi:MAG: riboflavin synthase, partial [Acidobacteriaceae bacterium]